MEKIIKVYEKDGYELKLIELNEDYLLQFSLNGQMLSQSKVEDESKDLRYEKGLKLLDELKCKLFVEYPNLKASMMFDEDLNKLYNEEI